METNPNTPAPKIQVKRIGRRWAVLLNGQVQGGGFFRREAAQTAADELARELKGE